MLALNSVSSGPCSFSSSSSSLRTTTVQFICLIVCCYAPGSQPTGVVPSNSTESDFTDDCHVRKFSPYCQGITYSLVFIGTLEINLLVLTFGMEYILVQRSLGNQLGLMKVHFLVWS